MPAAVVVTKPLIVVKSMREIVRILVSRRKVIVQSDAAALRCSIREKRVQTDRKDTGQLKSKANPAENLTDAA